VLTWRGPDIIVIDDPLKPEEALSQGQRQAANEWYDHTLYSRLNDKLTGAIVLIIRWHGGTLMISWRIRPSRTTASCPAMTSINRVLRKRRRPRPRSCAACRRS
jgi:hypothetical protein